MEPRLNPATAAPALMQSWVEFSKGVLSCGLEGGLVRLVTVRASQINGSASGIDAHTAAARKLGETEQRLYLLNAWRQSSLYSERERAALGWTEALTLVSETDVSDEVYEALQAQFSPEEQVKLTLLIVTVNGWNRVHLAFSPFHQVEKREAA
jgi:AhpD family alkylhydroperoxidase